MTKKLRLFFFSVMSFFLAHSQTGQIIGKINLLDIENKNTVLDSVYIILTSKNFQDSVRLKEDLSFYFKNLPADTFYISFSRRSYPYDMRYILVLGKSKVEKANIDYSFTCSFDKNKDGICPICKNKDNVIPIRYGLLSGKIEKNKKPEKRKYYPGGCMIFDCQASWYCEKDKKEF